MPGRLFLTSDMARIAACVNGTAPAGDIPHGLDLAPGDDILVLDETRTYRPMRWGMIMSGRVNARKRPVMETIINARSETVFDKSAFEGVRRAVVPCDGWYEWTGKTRAKTRWRITAKSGDPLFFAAIYDVWSGPGGIELPQVATVTCEPNADVRDIHHRMAVILPPALVGAWLNGQSIPMDPAPDGSLRVEEAQGMD